MYWNRRNNSLYDIGAVSSLGEEGQEAISSYSYYKSTLNKYLLFQIKGWDHSKKKYFFSFHQKHLYYWVGPLLNCFSISTSLPENWSTILSHSLFCPHPAKAEQHISAKPSKVLQLFRQNLRPIALKIPLQVEITSKLHLDMCLIVFHFICQLVLHFRIFLLLLSAFLPPPFLKIFPSPSFPQWFFLDRWAQLFSFFTCKFTQRAQVQQTRLVMSCFNLYSHFICHSPHSNNIFITKVFPLQVTVQNCSDIRVPAECEDMIELSCQFSV